MRLVSTYLIGLIFGVGELFFEFFAHGMSSGFIQHSFLNELTQVDLA